MNYTKDNISLVKDKIEKIKDICTVLYDIYSGSFKNLISRFKRDDLINLYEICKEHKTDDFIQYYRRTLINKYTDNST